MRPQATESNYRIISIICPFVCPSGRLRVFCNFCFCINFQCGFQCRGAFILKLGLSFYIPPYVCPYICLSVSLSVHTHRFFEIIRAARNCVQSMQPQATGSNYLSGSIIFPSVNPSVWLSVGILQFCVCINFHFWGPAWRCIYP